MASVPDDWSSLSAINPELKELLTTLPPNIQLVTETTTIDSLRAMRSSQPQSEKWPGIEETDIMVKMRDGHENRIRSYIPREGSVKGPLLVMIHGGGFCAGRLEHVEEDCRKWVRNHGGSAVSVSHRLAPEVRFPVPTDDSYDALKWVCLLSVCVEIVPFKLILGKVASNADTLKTDPAKGFIIGGM
jgi:acetyl esterase